MEDSLPDERELDAASERLAAAYAPAHFERDARATVEELARYLRTAPLGKGSVWPAVAPQELLARWPAPDAGVHEGGVPALLSDIFRDTTHQHHPGYVGQQLSAPPPVAALAALVVALSNNSSAIYDGAPVATVLERRIVSWLTERVGYGAEGAGVLTSGGSLGMLTALLAMRQAQAGFDAWTEGLSGHPSLAVLVSDQAHYCNHRACAILGLGARGVREVPTDERYVMTVDALARTYEEVLRDDQKPVAVIANAGSTGTGAHDPIRAIAGFAKEKGLWLHVDGAHGASALLSPRYAHLLDGVELSDSIVWDMHKMMMMPSLCTAVLIRNRRYLDAAFRQEASYLMGSDDGTPWYELAARTVETTKPGMAIPLYAALRTLGVQTFGDYLTYTYDLARAFAREVDARPDFELCTPPPSNIVCFRFVGERNEDLDELQLRIRDDLNSRRRYYVMRTRLRDRTWLRVVLMNPFTRLVRLRTLLDELAAAAKR